ncbi:pickpocket protein 19-like, partial [Leptopilina boulardi]|uniref:pickpocket protein 19-like n=1 Tax=Leptopilina boulardi TaxID=63433 RepID=UPI0021F67C71
FYISRSTIHGVKYILDPELHLIEKIIWLIFVIISICLTANVFVIMVTDFQAAPTEVIIESTNYRVSFLPFPSVTICPINRVDWKKAMKLEDKISNNSDVIENYRKLVATLSEMSFEGLYKLNFLNQSYYKELSDLNVTDIMFKIMPNCEDLLVKCQWRNFPQNCCNIFQVQKSEHGFCYSFNSLISENSSAVNELNMKKVTGYGSRSGLQVFVELNNITVPPNKYREKKQQIESGIFISINDPLVWPKVINRIKAGSIANINVKCTSGYASDDVLNLSPSKIPCRLMDHKRNVRYSQETCISECRREHVIKHCQCNPSFYFASVKNISSCRVKDLKCLYEKRGKFDNYQNPGDDNFKEGTQDVMTCDCPPACDYYNYEEKLLTVSVVNKNISLDIHYEGPTSIRYKMNVVTSGLKLLGKE